MSPHFSTFTPPLQSFKVKGGGIPSLIKTILFFQSPFQICSLQNMNELLWVFHAERKSKMVV